MASSHLIVFGISVVRELMSAAAMFVLIARYNVWIALILIIAVIP